MENCQQWRCHGVGGAALLREHVCTRLSQRAGQLLPTAFHSDRRASATIGLEPAVGAIGLRKVIAARGHRLRVLATNGIKNDQH